MSAASWASAERAVHRALHTHGRSAVIHYDRLDGAVVAIADVVGGPVLWGVSDSRVGALRTLARSIASVLAPTPTNCPGGDA